MDYAKLFEAFSQEAFFEPSKEQSPSDLLIESLASLVEPAPTFVETYLLADWQQEDLQSLAGPPPGFEEENFSEIPPDQRSVRLYKTRFCQFGPNCPHLVKRRCLFAHHKDELRSRPPPPSGYPSSPTSQQRRPSLLAQATSTPATSSPQLSATLLASLAPLPNVGGGGSCLATLLAASH